MNILHKVTRQILKKNKTRTWVTVIGIVLSAAMFTAVTTCVSSMQNFLLRTVIATEGSWHGAQFGVDAAELHALAGNEAVRDYTALERIGYALAGSENEYKPYLMVTGFDEKLTELLPILLQDGRMPENSGEILLPSHLKSNGRVEHTLGETLTLELGSRMLDGWEMNQSNPYDEKEQFVARESRTYTVVGFYQRPTFEDYSAPGYTALTLSEGEVHSADVYIRMKTPKEIYDLLDSSARANEVNTDLLRYTGMSNEGSYNRVLFGMATILMGIICFGSISLIYNAFSISVSERTKQFGILKTIGATKRQLQGSVIYEALVLSAIGIPLGVGSGILGIYITLLCTGDWFDALFSGYGVELRLYVTASGVLIAGAVCLVTVLISAWIPARRAIRMDAIESVRQSNDISIKAKKVRSPRWVYKIFGFEGMLADKNFKRNRKRYRATVVSLFVSVVLFISASSFCAYMNDAVGKVVYEGNYDISYFFNTNNEMSMGLEEFKAELENLDQVGEVSYRSTSYFTLQIADEYLTEEYRSFRAQWEADQQAAALADGVVLEQKQPVAYITFIDDATFRSWAEEQTGKSADRFFEEPLGIAVDGITQWDYSGNVYQTYHYLKKTPASYSFTYVPESIDGYQCVDYQEEKGVYIYENEAGDRLEYRVDDPLLTQTGTIGAVVQEDPWGTKKGTLQIVYPASMYFEVLPRAELPFSWEYQMTAVKNASAAEEQVEQLVEGMGLESGYLSNMAADNESDRALVGVLNVFSYGFIVLISLIALANVFNTISTNVALRRREFAMLRSVGMTEKGLNKMMNYECILYGVKGLAFGLAAAVGVTFLIYLTVSAGVATSFYLPWYSVAIAVGSVFVVVFVTMIYAMRKIKKEDPMEALKNENL